MRLNRRSFLSTSIAASAASAVHAGAEERDCDIDSSLDRLHRKVKAIPDTGLKADKEFFDSLYED